MEHSAPANFLCQYADKNFALQIKAEDCLKLEEERVSNYMHQSTRVSLLKEVETELLQQHQTTLLEKEQSGCAALLQDDKVMPCHCFMHPYPQVQAVLLIHVVQWTMDFHWSHLLNYC